MLDNQFVYWLLVVLSFIWLPIVIDFIPGYRAMVARNVLTVEPDNKGPQSSDMAILVPIYGNIKYLVNIDFLAPYGDRVILATTAEESDEFYRDLHAVAHTHGFRITKTPVKAKNEEGKRATSAPIRDVVIRGAVRHVTHKYVVCLDADTFPEEGFDSLAGVMEENELEVVSVNLVVVNTDRWLGKLQSLEYRLAMRLRTVLPWLVSGGCHAATTEAYRNIMDNHSMFFQGNDVEVGLLGKRLGYKVGHIDYRVLTEAPDTLKPWWRQRYAWAGGEYRLGVRNLRYAPDHPWFFFYLTIVTIGMWPIRWWFLIQAPWIIIPIYVIYFILVSILLKQYWRPLVALYPLYTLVNSLVTIPLGLISYIRMSMKYDNWGHITHSPEHREYVLGDGKAPAPIPSPPAETLPVSEILAPLVNPRHTCKRRRLGNALESHPKFTIKPPAITARNHHDPPRLLTGVS